MPLVAHSNLPSFQRLREAGEEVLELDRAEHQDIRALHIGLLNMMPDAALEATERQFMRLVGSSNRIAQFYVHPFTVSGIPREGRYAEYVARHYRSFEEIAAEGLDALIITGANWPGSRFSEAPFWPELSGVLDFARERVTSTLCACLATHAALGHMHGIKRRPLEHKRWGVYHHRCASAHPLTRNINTRFDVPHSRYNEITPEQMKEVGLRILVDSEEVGVHLAVSPDGLRFVYQQGHPEYDRNSLLKEYKREVMRFARGERADFPPLPTHYFGPGAAPILEAIERDARSIDEPGFVESELLPHVDNTWGDTARTTFNNWLGLVYQLTNRDRRLPFMAGVDPDDPLGLQS